VEFLWSSLSLLALVGSLGGTVHLLLHYRRPASAVSWLFALWFLPLFGVALYLMFSVYEGPRRVRRRRRLSRHLRERERLVQRASDASEFGDRLASVAERVGALPPIAGNAIDLHADGPAARAACLELLRSAEVEILLETYSWEDDAFTREVVQVLAEKLAAGVDVRVLIDGIGARRFFDRNLRGLIRAGIPFERFLEPNPLKGRFQINFRNHRKILAVDGKRAIVGGRNCVLDYYETGDDSVRDLTVTIVGPAVEALRNLFLEDWIVATESLDEEPADLRAPESVGDTVVRVIPHGTDEDRDAFLPLLSAALREAESEILIVTPYFVPGISMTHELEMAALMGIRVRLLVPRRSPERWPDIGARRFFGSLLEAGVEIYRRPLPFIHAKAIIVDDKRSFLGSANFDQRSFHLNYELTCEIPDGRFSKALLEHFAPDLELAERLDPKEFANRPWHTRVAENFVALFEPLL
jgi:cardiolipin synthase A/B